MTYCTATGTVTNTLSLVLDSMLTSSCWMRREIGRVVLSMNGALRFRPGRATLRNFPNLSTITFSWVCTVNMIEVRRPPNRSPARMAMTMMAMTARMRTTAMLPQVPPLSLWVIDAHHAINVPVPAITSDGLYQRDGSSTRRLERPRLTRREDRAAGGRRPADARSRGRCGWEAPVARSGAARGRRVDEELREVPGDATAEHSAF